jgi:hypothetical protein
MNLHSIIERYVSGSDFNKTTALTPELYNQIASNKRICLMIAILKHNNAHGYMKHETYLQLEAELKKIIDVHGSSTEIYDTFASHTD